MAEKTKKFIVTNPNHSGLDAHPPVHVNGKDIAYTLNEPIDLTEAAASAIQDCAALHIEPFDPESSVEDDDDGAASPTGGAGEGGSDTFDAAAVIDGNVADVSGRVAALETAEEIEAVRAAETEGSNRKGVIDALDARAAELTQE